MCNEHIGVYFRVCRLKEQCDRVHVRKLMMKYGLKNVEVPQGADAEVKTEETIFSRIRTFLYYKIYYMAESFQDFF